jgi:hypothetical protein
VTGVVGPRPEAAAVASWDRAVAEGLDLVARAERAGLTLRLVGSVACRVHCGGRQGVLDALAREQPPDVDLVAPAGSRAGVRALLRDLGYQEDRDMLVAMEGRRYAFRSPDRGLQVDLFVDRLEFCHPIDVTGRFGLDSPTLPLADLALSKLQIVRINQKDLKDLTVLLLEHPCGSGDREAVDVTYLARLASEDWGLYYTMSRNVARLRAFLEQAGALSGEDRRTAASRLEELWEAVEAAPKGIRWRLRARVGPRVQWYQEVTEKEPTF